MTEQTIKNLRVNIDEVFQRINSVPKSRETALAYTSAQLSKMWLGKVLQYYGVANPYPNSKDSSNITIEPTADVANIGITSIEVDTEKRIQYIKWLRSIIDQIADVLVWDKEYKDGYNEWKKDEEIILAVRLAKQYIVESGMWLGMELGRIRDMQG